MTSIFLLPSFSKNCQVLADCRVRIKALMNLASLAVGKCIANRAGHVRRVAGAADRPRRTATGTVSLDARAVTNQAAPNATYASSQINSLQDEGCSDLPK